MMQDYIRTSTYQRAMLSNITDFHDKIVLDVGAGSGILSFFALQAGAKKVYAIEASSMAQHCEVSTVPWINLEGAMGPFAPYFPKWPTKIYKFLQFSMFWPIT